MGNFFTSYYGYRAPGSARYHNAMLFSIRWNGKPGQAVIFENGLDYIGQPNRAELDAALDYVIGRGWVPMTGQDIRETGGV